MLPIGICLNGIHVGDGLSTRLESQGMNASAARGLIAALQNGSINVPADHTNAPRAGDEAGLFSARD